MFARDRAGYKETWKCFNQHPYNGPFFATNISLKQLASFCTHSTSVISIREKKKERRKHLIQANLSLTMCGQLASLRRDMVGRTLYFSPMSCPSVVLYSSLLLRHCWTRGCRLSSSPLPYRSFKPFTPRVNYIDT